MPNTSIPTTLFKKPDFYPVNFNNENMLFAQMTRESYFNSLFLDQNRIQSTLPPTTLISVDALDEALKSSDFETKPVNFIFHTANCGSTLLSRALDMPTRSIAYREPATLRQLGIAYTSLRASNANLDQWNLKLKLSSLLLSRRFSETEIPIIKANIPVNFILTPLLEAFRVSRSLLLYSDLESFLISALKIPQRRIWVQNVAKSLSNVIEPAQGRTIFNNNEHFIAKTAASLWIAQIQIYHDVIKSHEGFKSLTSDQFFNNTQSVLANAADHFQLNFSDHEIIKITESNLFEQHSKNPLVKYDNARRKADHQTLLKTLAPELAEGMRWGEQLMEKYNISGTLKNSLI